MIKQATELQRFLKLMTHGKGKRFTRLAALLKAGNFKLPKSTAIFNMGSATDCPSKELGFCQAVIDGKIVCYALRPEEFRPAVLPYRREQEKYWKGATAEHFAAEFVLINTLKQKSFKALRLNESGDFWGQDCVDKAERIAKILKGFGVDTYCYTARSDLNFLKTKNLVVNGSGFIGKGVKNIFMMITDKEEKPKGFALCPADCKKCSRCLTNGHKTAILKH